MMLGRLLKGWTPGASPTLCVSRSIPGEPACSTLAGASKAFAISEWRTLADALQRAGFGDVWRAPPVVAYELRAIGFKRPATSDQRRLLGILGD